MPSEAPKGRAVKRGNRGAYYYITSEKQHSHPKSNVQSGPRRSSSSKKKHGWNIKRKDNKGGSEEPDDEPLDLPGADSYMAVKGEGVSVYFMDFGGRIQCEALQNDDTLAFMDLIRNCFKSGPEDMLKCVKRLAKANGLIVTEG
jgi:hypothetical protein